MHIPLLAVAKKYYNTVYMCDRVELDLLFWFLKLCDWHRVSMGNSRVSKFVYCKEEEHNCYTK